MFPKCLIVHPPPDMSSTSCRRCQLTNLTNAPIHHQQEFLKGIYVCLWVSEWMQSRNICRDSYYLQSVFLLFSDTEMKAQDKESLFTFFAPTTRAYVLCMIHGSFLGTVIMQVVYTCDYTKPLFLWKSCTRTLEFQSMKELFEKLCKFMTYQQKNFKQQLNFITIKVSDYICQLRESRGQSKQIRPPYGQLCCMWRSLKQVTVKLMWYEHSSITCGDTVRGKKKLIKTWGHSCFIDFCKKELQSSNPKIVISLYR